MTQQTSAVFRTRFGNTISFTLSTKPVLTNAFPAAKLTVSDVQFLRDNSIFLSNIIINGEFVKPSILIGVESYEQVLNNPPVRLPSGLLAQNTIFGLALIGCSITAKGNNPHSQLSVVACPRTVDIKQELRDMYELEGMGISTDEYKTNDTAYDYKKSFENRITIEGGAITTPFPLKDNVVDLKNNYSVAASRINALYKFHRSLHDQKLWYSKIIEEYRINDIIEEVPPVERYCADKTTFCLPHSGVWRSDKPTPVRIVFDTSSKAKGKLSLNDVMHTGESFVNKIQDIFLVNRWCKTFITADNRQHSLKFA